jgi:Mn-dependent DtxR family transcriptional regulator
MDDQLILGTLDSLYHLSEMTLPTDAGAIARRLGRSASEVGAALLHLERRGLADASLARLTLAGLAAAAALRAGSRCALAAA